MGSNLPSQKRRLRVVALLVVIFMLGMGLRLHRLDADSLWSDEIRTSVRAQLDLRSLVTRLALGEGGGVQLPLMYAVTHFFVAVFGDSEFVPRLQAMLFGSLSILLAYKAGEILWTEEVGLMASFLLAVNAYHVEYSQEARHYALMIFLALLSLIFLLKALQKNQIRLWIGFVLFTSLSLYNHCLAFLFLPAEIMFATWVIAENWLSHRRKGGYAAEGRPSHRFSTPARQTAMFLAALALIAASYLPWLPTLQAQFVDNAAPGSVGVSVGNLQRSLSYARRILTVYTGAQGPPLILWLAASLLGLATCDRKRIALLVLWIGMPFAFLSVMTPSRSLYARYAIVILPLYLLTTARGLAVAARWMAHRSPTSRGSLALHLALAYSLSVLIFGVLAAPSLRNHYTKHNPDWRSAAYYLKANMLPGDLVLADGEHLHTGHDMRVQDCLSFYFDRSDVPPTPILPVGRGLAQAMAENVAEADRQIWAVVHHTDGLAFVGRQNQPLIAGFDYVSIVRLSKPSGDILQDTVSLLRLLLDLLTSAEAKCDLHLALAEIYLRIGAFQQAELQLQTASQLKPHACRHLSPPSEAGPQLRQRSDAMAEDSGHSLWRSFGLQIALFGYDLDSESVEAGGTLDMTLWWQALAEMDKDYTAFVHVLGPDDRMWAQQDVVLQDGGHPTSAWELGKTVRDKYRLQLPSDTRPGEYLVKAGIYYWETGERLPVWDEEGQRVAGELVALGTITVTNWWEATAEPQRFR